MSKKDDYNELEEIEVESIDLLSLNNKLDSLRDDVEMLKKLKRKQKKLNKLEQEKNKILEEMANEDKKSRKKHK